MANKKRQYHTESFRKSAVDRANQPGVKATDVAKELGIHVNQLYNWRNQLNKLRGKQFSVMDGVNYTKAEKEEIKKLRKENNALREERDFLKKATAYFAKVKE